MPRPLHPIIPEANELGYFPTHRQAVEINCRSAELYAQHFGGRPPRGRIVEDVYKPALLRALEEVMSRPRGRRGRPGPGA